MSNPQPLRVVERPLSDSHIELLGRSAVDQLVAIEAGVYSVERPADLPAEFESWRRHNAITPGIMFPAVGPDGAELLQYRPDAAAELEGEERPRKYLFPKGVDLVLAQHPRMAARADATTLLVVEGTKQHLAAVSATGDDIHVVGVTGCNGWSSDGVPLTDWNHLPVDGIKVVIAFDADVATNRSVHDAASKLAEHLELLGAMSVRFLTAPTGAKAGLDDYLATIPSERRQAVLSALVEKAGPLPKAPPRKRAKPKGDDPAAMFFDQNGLKANTLCEAVRNGRHHALAGDGSLWTYDPSTGLYCDDEHAVVKAVRDLLGERYRGLHARTVTEMLVADLAAEGRRLRADPLGRLLPVRNGMLDVSTGELLPFSPDHLAYAGLNVEWNPSATCPLYDEWIAGRCGAQVDDLHEALGLMLTPSAGQRRVPFFIGPTRSGKGTVLRIIESMIPETYRAAVTLHDLATSRFAAAQLYGKVLNSAGDLSDHHVDDLSLFKMLTGADSVTAERKFRDGFVFRNSAMFVFSANTPPTVSETSRAYLARVRPYLFPHSYEGAEDPAIEAALLEELPGVLVRLVEGVRRWNERGGYAPVNPIVADLFARQSDPVAMFVAQVLEPADGEFTSTTAVHDSYRCWATANGRAAMGRNKLLARVDNVLGPRQREHGTGRGAAGWRGWRALPERDWTEGETTYEQSASAIEPVSAGYAASSSLTPHEEEHEEEREEQCVPREGGVGPKAAYVAESELSSRGAGVQYPPAPCDVCGETILLRPGRDTGCVLTPGCIGRHRHQLERSPSPAPTTSTGTDALDGLF